MILFDILTLAVIGWMIFRGKNDGLVSQVLSLAGIALGVFLALSYGEGVGNVLNLDPQYSAIAGFTIILVTMVIIALFLAKIISKSISGLGLAWLDSILGILFGVIKGLAILGLFYAAIFAVNERVKAVEPKEFDKSVSFNVVRKIADPLLDYWEKTAPVAYDKLQSKPEA